VCRLHRVADGHARTGGRRDADADRDTEPDGHADGDRSAHADTLRGAESWQGGYAVVYIGDDAALQEDEQNVTLSGVVEGDERRRYTEFGNVSVDRYTAGSDAPTYARTDRDSEVSYSREQSGVDLSTVSEVPLDAEDFADWEYEVETVGTDRGERVKYAADDPAAAPDRVLESIDGEVTDITFRVYVDPDRDLVTDIEYGVEISREEGTVTAALNYQVYGLGRASVQEPDWLDEARESTG